MRNKLKHWLNRIYPLAFLCLYIVNGSLSKCRFHPVDVFLMEAQCMKNKIYSGKSSTIHNVFIYLQYSLELSEAEIKI